jgi:hypothetical protein
MDFCSKCMRVVRQNRYHHSFVYQGDVEEAVSIEGSLVSLDSPKGVLRASIGSFK